MKRAPAIPLLLALVLICPTISSLAMAERATSNTRGGNDVRDASAIPFAFSLLEGGIDGQMVAKGWHPTVPEQTSLRVDDRPWWERTTLDSDRNGIHDSLAPEILAGGPAWVGISYGREVTSKDITSIESLGLQVRDEIPAVDAVLLGEIDSALIPALRDLSGVVMVEEYGLLRFYGDVQTQAVKARASAIYPDGAWNLSVSGDGVNIALTDTGVDDDHPGLAGKFIAGYDAVCYLHTDPACLLAGGRAEDGSFNPDDGNQHGTACMGMAAATGLEADGSQSEFYGSAPNATLIDVRIGTDVGAGPFENYVLEQEFYESAMNGVQWIIDHRDDAWQGVDESRHGIDIISLSWGITSHEGGGSDGEDMHSRILDAATEAGVTVSVAAGNDGPDNDGLSGMGSSSLSITVGATDDQNSIERDDDTVAGYSSRGPRRDNGDGNPLNELKPDLSAPGTNIVQAEGCVTSGGCNDFAGGSASDNTYTGRGSGTSYATPAVTGVIAMVIEANPELDPLQIREVLKQTAERRGEATQPDVDPYWNRDFGWGMVDARAAVELALHLNATEQSSTFQPTIQNHLLNATGTNGSNGTIVLQGHAWAQNGVVDRVEFRIDDGEWTEATYNDSSTELAPLTPFEWMVALDPTFLDVGNHTIEVRAVSGDGHSLPVVVNVAGVGSEIVDGSLGLVIAGAAFVLALLAAGTLLLSQSSNETLDDLVIDAEVIDAATGGDDLDYLTVAQLKERLSAAGLPVSGRKTDLIERLRD